jgi:hypothetical protein
MDAAGSHAAEFAVNQGQVGENGKGETYQHNAQSVEPVRENWQGEPYQRNTKSVQPA